MYDTQIFIHMLYLPVTNNIRNSTCKCILFGTQYLSAHFILSIPMMYIYVQFFLFAAVEGWFLFFTLHTLLLVHNMNCKFSCGKYKTSAILFYSVY